jgi:uncharacterized protein
METNNLGHILLALIRGSKRYFGCGVGKGRVAVSVSGDIYPCHRFAGHDDMKMGNIAEYRVEGLNDYHLDTVDNRTKCLVCWARYLCGGGCLYNNKALTGDTRVPDDNYCTMVQRSIETALYMYSRLDDGDKEYIKNACKAIEEGRLP